MKRFLFFIITACTCACFGQSQQETPQLPKYIGPIIDMHIHADGAEALPPIPIALCPPFSTLVPGFDPKEEFPSIWEEKFMEPECGNPLMSPENYEDYLESVGNQLEKNRVLAIASGSVAEVLDFRSRYPGQVIPSLQFRLGRDSVTAEQMKSILLENEIQIIGEISNQYGGIAPDDPRLFPYYEMAQELDIPVAIHLGSGIPGTPYMGYPEFRAELSNPLLLEDVLKRFPKLRVSVMHYGEPFIDEMITMMYHYPQLYVDLGGIQWAYPRAYFYEYHLKKMVLAGFGKRIMFGSDMIIWPELIEHSIDIIQEAPFLTQDQKADIFYNNAARFLRLGNSE